MIHTMRPRIAFATGRHRFFDAIYPAGPNGGAGARGLSSLPPGCVVHYPSTCAASTPYLLQSAKESLRSGAAFTPKWTWRGETLVWSVPSAAAADRPRAS
jgi:hypothetical protein